MFFDCMFDLVWMLLTCFPLLTSLSGGHVIGEFSPHEAFAIGGTNSVRGYEEGAVGSGRSYVVGSGEISFPMVSLSIMSPLFWMLILFLRLLFKPKKGSSCVELTLLAI